MWISSNNRFMGRAFYVCSTACLLMLMSTLLLVQTCCVKPAASAPLLSPAKTKIAGVAAQSVVGENGLTIWYQIDQDVVLQRILAAIQQNLSDDSKQTCDRLVRSGFQADASVKLSTQQQAQRLQQLERRWQRQVKRLFRQQQQRLLQSGGIGAYRIRAFSLSSSQQGTQPVVISWPLESIQRQLTLCEASGDSEHIGNAQAVTLTLSLMANQQHVQVELSVNAG